MTALHLLIILDPAVIHRHVWWNQLLSCEVGWCWGLYIELPVWTLKILLLIHWHHFDWLLLFRSSESLLVTVLRRFEKVNSIRMMRDVALD